jgi:hypothetical protein
MVKLVLISAVGIAVCVLLIKLMADWGERYFTRALSSTLNDTEHIVNEGKLPETWVQPFRERIEIIRRKGGTESQTERVGQKARQRFLRDLDDMIKFFQERNVTDGEETRQFLLASLKEQQDRVAAAAWQDLLEPEASTQDTTETPSQD